MTSSVRKTKADFRTKTFKRFVELCPSEYISVGTAFKAGYASGWKTGYKNGYTVGKKRQQKRDKNGHK